MTDATPTEPTTPPYTVVELDYGGHKRPTRLYPSGAHGGILSPDEIGVWAHLQAVTAERDALAAELAALKAAAEAKKPKKAGS